MQGVRTNPDVIEANKAVIGQFLTRIFEQGDLAALDDFVALPSLRGILRNDVPNMHETLADIRCPVEQMVGEEDGVAVEFTLTGLPRGVESGTPISVLNLAIFRMEEGKIAGASVLADRLGMLQQLGVDQVPPLAPCPVE